MSETTPDREAVMAASPFNDPGKMSSPERVSAALAGRSVDRVPLQAGHSFAGEFRERWARAKGLPECTMREIDEYYGGDVVEIAADHTPWPTGARKVEETDEHVIEIDGFGGTRETIKGKPFWLPLAYALEDKSKLGEVDFDAPELDSRYDGLLRGAEASRGRYYAYVKVGGPYSRSKWMRGEEQFLIDMIEDPPFVKALVDRVADHMTAVGLESVRRAGLDETAIHVHDDMASLDRMFFSPAAFDEFLFEPYRRMCEAFHAAGLRVFYGGEGNISEVFGRFLDAGIDGFICLELRAGMDMVELREKYGPEPVFFGNICNTVTLPSGDRERIRAEVARQMEVARRGRCVVGPSHLVGADVTIESYEWMIEAIREWGAA